MSRDILLDTQLVSYAMKGRYALPAVGCAITSVTAQELLLMQGSKFTRNNYYVPLFTDPALSIDASSFRRHLKGMPSRIRSHAGQRATDKFVLNFGKDYAPVIEYSHLAISKLLNAGRGELIKSYASVLDRKSRRVVAQRIDFLIDNRVQCRPLSENLADAALHMFATFTQRHALKKSFRNSLNDLLSLTIAVDDDALFKTRDRLLAKFSAEFFPSSLQDLDGVLTIEFAPPGESRKVNRGTKGYVNRGWGVRRQNWQPFIL
ncbi:hypothetical protein [Micromonospora chalcea]|uniref:hypothetical protein n=1 Tax=Micromonospora chalcea TaxID=1874 RepID=UPI0033206958